MHHVYYTDFLLLELYQSAVNESRVRIELGNFIDVHAFLICTLLPMLIPVTRLVS